MSKVRMWRIRFTEQTSTARPGDFWFQTIRDHPDEIESGKWKVDPLRFTSLTTKEACNVQWSKKDTFKPGAEDPEDPTIHPIGGRRWEFEYVGTVIPLTEDDPI